MGEVRRHAVGAVVAIALCAGGCGAAPTEGTGSSVTVEGGGGTAVGDQAPSFTATLINGGQVKLPAGEPAVLFFMATWCRPDLEATALDRIERELGDKLTVVGVDIDPSEPAADLRAYADKVGARYSYVHDVSGALTKALAIRAMDSTVVVDATGRIVYRDTVPTDEATLRGALAKATGNGAGGGGVS